jgi:hypothetical protein
VLVSVLVIVEGNEFHAYNTHVGVGFDNRQAGGGGRLGSGR